MTLLASRAARRALVYPMLALLLWQAAVSLAWGADGEPGPPAVAADGGNFIWEVLTNLFDSSKLLEVLKRPQFVVASFVVLNAIVFVETGLLVGFCLPGDSLLVTAGLVCAEAGWSLPLLLATLCVSAVVGDSLGYYIGYRTGPAIFSREKSLLFHKDHLLKAQQFYERHGGKTIVLARFMPILRTFAPVVAGVGRMEYRRFVFFNVLGGVGWVCSMILAGFWLTSVLKELLGPDFEVQRHIEKVVIVVVLLSLAPGLVAWLRHRAAKSPLDAQKTAA